MIQRRVRAPGLLAVALCAASLLLSIFSFPLWSQTISGSITGTVVDPQGGVIPDATVKATDTKTQAVSTTSTDSSGHFVFPSLLPSTYMLAVSVQGFKSYRQTGLVLTANSALPVGTIKMQVGVVQQSIEVSAQGQKIQTDTAQISTSIVGKQLHNIQVNGRSPLFMLRMIPGVVSDNDYSQSNVNFGNNYVNGSRGNESNFTLNGAGNVDTGSNGSSIVTVSLDSLQEFQVLTSNYQAQYGRSAGAQISMVTKSGTRTFHGSAYEYYRDKGMNANSWINNRQGLPKADYHYNDYGFTIGGPVYFPRLFNKNRDKLFFFWSNEWQRQLVPKAQKLVTVPTALERKGDFSQSVDKNGHPVTIVNPFAGGAPFAGNTIPANMLSPQGVGLMNIYPLPNALSAVNKGFNYSSQISDSLPRLEDLVRIDWLPSSKWHIYGSYILNHQNDVSAYGSFVLGANIPIVPISDDRPGYLTTYSVVTVLNPTTVNEATFDIAHNQITIAPTVNGGLTLASTHLTGLNSLYPPHEDYLPSLDFSGTRIANSPSFGSSDAPFYNYNTTIEAIDNFSKVWGQHTLKAGFYFQRSRKDQSSFAPFNGSIHFGDDPNNPLDSGFGYSNAALGIFDYYQQASQYAIGAYRYTNFGFYVQDTWKATRRLTFDYGVRFYYIQPQYDASDQASNFLPSAWSAAAAPQLYQPALNSMGQRVAKNPITGQLAPSVDIGTIVPGSGNLTNGIIQAGKGSGVSKYLYDSPGILPAPRFGFTYDITGHQNVVFHAGGGIFYDRYQGNEIFSLLTNPPTTFEPTVYYGQLSNLNINNATIGTSSLSGISQSGQIPTIYNYSAGVESRLPWALTLDTSYVGSQSRHLIARINLNAIPYGATFQPQNQDPTLQAAHPKASLGSNALPSPFLAPYRGYSDSINNIKFDANSNYNSLQVSLQRRFARGLFFGVAYTYSKCMDVADGDGNYERIDQYNHYANYGECGFDRTHDFQFNYVYTVPNLPQSFGRFNNVVTRALFDNWQFSGLVSFVSGTPLGVGFSIPNVGNPQLTGSYTEPARVALTGAGPNTGTSGDPYNRINPAAFRPPPVGTIGLSSPRNDIRGPGRNNFNMSLDKRISITERASLELRVDAFNVFNHAQFNGLETTINFTSLTDGTPTNLPYNSQGHLTNLFGFGSVSGVYAPRILQVMARFSF